MPPNQQDPGQAPGKLRIDAKHPAVVAARTAKRSPTIYDAPAKASLYSSDTPPDEEIVLVSFISEEEKEARQEREARRRNAMLAHAQAHPQSAAESWGRTRETRERYLYPRTRTRGCQMPRRVSTRERRPGSTRPTTSRRTRSTSSARAADPPPPADPPSAEDIEQGLLSLIYWSDLQAQRRAFEAALVELEDLLRGDRVDYEQIDAFVELHRGDRWGADYHEEFPDWLGDECPELFERDITGMSFLREPWS